MSRLSPALIAIALAVLNGCGGAKDSTAPPPGPTVITLSAARGSAQETPPGTALPVNVAVMAKNAAGQPVAGLTITFAVDSGGRRKGHGGVARQRVEWIEQHGSGQRVHHRHATLDRIEAGSARDAARGLCAGRAGDCDHECAGNGIRSMNP